MTLSVLRNTLLRLVVWTLFITLGFVAVVRTGLTAGPVGGVFATAQNIVQRQTIAVDGNTAMIGPLDAPASGLAYTMGHFLATDSPGAALLAVPAVWVGLPLADGLGEPDAAILLVGMTAVFLLVFAGAALAWAGARLGLSPALALCGGAIGAGAFLFPVGALTNSVAAFAIVGVLLALTLADGADSRVEEGWTPHGRLTLAGLLLGCLPLMVWYGGIAVVGVGIALIVQGGRKWWLRVPWLFLGAVGPLIALAILNAIWFDRPWRQPWMYATGDGWQRTLSGRFLDTPITALRAALSALAALAARHPLIVVGFIGLLIGLFFVPWRTRTTTFILFVTVAVPALIERQPNGLVAETHPVMVIGAFAAAGYVVLVALTAREWPKLVRWMLPVSLLIVAAGAAVSILTGGADRPALIPIGNQPAAYVAPIALCVGVIALLITPGLHVPRVRRDRAITVSALTLLLLNFLVGCGASSATNRTVRDAPNLLPPLGTRIVGGAMAPIWTLDANARVSPDGQTMSAVKEAGTVLSPRISVQAGDGYRLTMHVLVMQPGAPAALARLQWFDATQRALGEQGMTLPLGLPDVRIAAPVGAASVALTLTIPPGVAIDTVRLEPRDGGRLDALPAFSKAALAFSFDFETAMGGLIHTRGGEVDHDVKNAEARAMAMRDGATFLRRLFAAYDTRATFYVNGYNFLTGNTAHRQFVGNPTYTRYTAKTAGFASDYWTTHPWYGDDPFGTEDTNPAWYFGSLTKQLAQDGHDIENHTFGHLFLHAGITPKQLDDDLTEWDNLAKQSGYAPAHSFAFPWGASNSVTDEYYAVLATHGITNVTRFYDRKPGTYDLQAVPVYPQIAVVPDQELIDRAGDEMAATRGIDLTLASGGVFSLWAHPESIATPTAQAIWGRVVAYAADRRAQGLWVAPVTTITNFVDARARLDLSSIRVGTTTILTVRNTGPTGCNDATLTLPSAPTQVAWTGGDGAREIRGPQIRVGNIAAGATVTLEARYP